MLCVDKAKVTRLHTISVLEPFDYDRAIELKDIEQFPHFPL